MIQITTMRAGKNYVSTSLAETYAMRGQHVHLHPITCYNGTEWCDKFVQRRLHWDGVAFQTRSEA